MLYANPLTEELSIILNETEYSRTIYKQPISIENIIDENYPNYSDDDTYNTGDYVIVPELKLIYRCTADNTSGKHPLENPDLWVCYGFVNSYRMLATDEYIGAKTTAIDPKIVLDVSSCDVAGLINTKTSYIDLRHIAIFTNYYLGKGDGSTTEFNIGFSNIIENTDKVYINGNETTDYSIDYDEGKITFDNPPADGDVLTIDFEALVAEYRIDGKDIGCLSFAEYFYDPIKEKTRFIIKLDFYAQARLELQFNGDTTIGNIVTGLTEELGITLMGTSLTFNDNSKITIDEFTNTRKVIRYGHIRILKGKIVFENEFFDTIAQKISSIIGRNVLFIPDENDKFSEMTNLAYIEDVELPVENSVITTSSITIIGVEE